MIPATLQFAHLRDAYRNGRLTPVQVAEAALARGRLRGPGRLDLSGGGTDVMARARALAADPALADALPLYGLPFAVKDNIDVAGLPTTAACPSFACTPERDATVVRKLRDAGAIVIGKTNLDQFATGLNGTRSPYGAPRCVFDERYISGGSSSGSAVAVSAGLVAFSLGTDTAGSGRVPAAFNNIVGLKPTKGLLSTTGVVPACRSIDCISIFAASASDALQVLRVAEGFDPADPFSRLPTPLGFPRIDSVSACSHLRTVSFAAIREPKRCTITRSVLWRRWAERRSRSRTNRFGARRRCCTTTRSWPSGSPGSRPSLSLTPRRWTLQCAPSSKVPAASRPPMRSAPNTSCDV